jgi:hypothetical protein
MQRMSVVSTFRTGEHINRSATPSLVHSVLDGQSLFSLHLLLAREDGCLILIPAVDL